MELILAVVLGAVGLIIIQTLYRIGLVMYLEHKKDKMMLDSLSEEDKADVMAFRKICSDAGVNHKRVGVNFVRKKDERGVLKDYIVFSYLNRAKNKALHTEEEKVDRKKLEYQKVNDRMKEFVTKLKEQGIR